MLQVRRTERLLELEGWSAQLLVAAAAFHYALVLLSSAAIHCDLLVHVVLVLVVLVGWWLLLAGARGQVDAGAGAGAGVYVHAVEICADGGPKLEEREHVAHRREQWGARDVGRVCRETGAQEGFQVLRFGRWLRRRRRFKDGADESRCCVELLYCTVPTTK